MTTLQHHIPNNSNENITTVNVLALWKRYESDPSPKLKQELVIHYMWLVKYIIKKMNLPSNAILNDEDFVSVGVIGLSDCIDRFSLDRGVKFESYATARIRGIIQDEMRKLDWLSRTARKKAVDYINANDTLTMQAGEQVSQLEVMEKLEITPEQYKKYIAAAAAAKASITMNESSMAKDDSDDTSILENMAEADEDSFTHLMEKKEREDLIKNFLSMQKEKPRLVMSLYYFEELTFKEIGTVLNVSESRICQIHAQVIKDLKRQIQKFNYGQ